MSEDRQPDCSVLERICLWNCRTATPVIAHCKAGMLGLTACCLSASHPPAFTAGQFARPRPRRKRTADFSVRLRQRRKRVFVHVYVVGLKPHRILPPGAEHRTPFLAHLRLSATERWMETTQASKHLGSAWALANGIFAACLFNISVLLPLLWRRPGEFCSPNN